MGRNRLFSVFRLLSLLVIAGCAVFDHSGESLVPTRYATRTGPYVVFTNFPIAADAPEIQHLQALERQVAATLGLRVDPGEPPVEVYILNDRQAFAHFMQFYYPELPPRRAFFMAQGSRRVVYTYRGERLEEDLRHEATHALLHAVVAEVPLWLDEGLAEYFEGPDDHGGVNAEHLGRWPQDRAEGWVPQLARLETLKDVHQMSPRDYRESWAWVHYLLNGPPAGKAALVSYLADLRAHPDTAPLSVRLDGTPSGAGPQLLVHIERLREPPVATAGPVRNATIRLQSVPAEAPVPSVPAEAPPRHRGLLARLREFFSAR
jgi:hypothetical protein